MDYVNDNYNDNDNDNEYDNEYGNQKRPRHRSIERMSYANKGRFFVIRNILNIIFMILAVIGMIMYFYGSQTLGGILLITAVIIKISECVLRIIP